MATVIQSHCPCPDCGSSDALTYYDWGSVCYSCNKKTKGATPDNQPTESKAMTIDTTSIQHPAQNYVTMVERALLSDTMKKYGVSKDAGRYWFPFYTVGSTSGTPEAYKTRSEAEKRFKIEAPNGVWSKTQLFGQQLFNKGGKYITITEGEFDALSAYQMMGSKYPVVSIQNGAASAVEVCRNNYEWLDSFENIVICFDNDEPGVKAAKKVAELFGVKARVVKLTDHKDASDYLQSNHGKKFVEQWWAAEQFVPDGIVCGSQLWDLVNQPNEKASVMYPFEGINKLTYGIREGELVTVTAGSGLGKSQFLREIVYHIIKNSDERVGLMFLEESTKKTAKSLMSLACNKLLHLPDTEATDEELRSAFDETLGTDRVYLFDHFGSTAVDNIINRVRYLAKALNCKYIFLDHISIVVSGQDNGDERKALDEIMTKLRMIVQETGIALFAVSHLKRPESKGHEEGAATSLAQLRGSGSIAQLSDMVIGLERNGQADDVNLRNTTRVRVLKNRYCGITGPAASLLYDHDTGRMNEVEDEDDKPL